MHGWAKQIKKHFPKAVISEGKDHMEASLDGELLLSVIRDGRGRMVDNQSDSHALYSLDEVNDPSWSPGAEWDEGQKKYIAKVEESEEESEEDDSEEAPAKKLPRKK